MPGCQPDGFCCEHMLDTPCVYQNWQGQPIPNCRTCGHFPFSGRSPTLMMPSHASGSPTVMMPAHAKSSPLSVSPMGVVRTHSPQPPSSHASGSSRSVRAGPPRPPASPVPLRASTSPGRWDHGVGDDLAKLHGTMIADSWAPSYVARLIATIRALRVAGIRQLLPETLTPASDGVTLLDEHQMPFGKLRTALPDFINSQLGFQSDEIMNWLTGVGGDSWSQVGVMARQFWMSCRTHTHETYYWAHGVLHTAHHHHQGDQEQFLRALYPAARPEQIDQIYQQWLVWHAYTLEFLSTTLFPNNDRARGTIRLMRTVVPEALYLDGGRRLSPNHLPCGQLTHSVLEPTSCFRLVNVSLAQHYIMLEVPHHRVIGTYMQGPPLLHGRGSFKDDIENEFQAILCGLESRLYSGTSPPLRPGV